MRHLLALLVSLFCANALGATFEGKIEDWRGKQKESFSEPEANFKLVLKKLRESYVDRDVSEEELYRAATAGMLAALNSGKPDEDWNELLSRRQLEDFMIEKTGKLTGVGVTMQFDDKTGYARVLSVIPRSAALKAGMKKDDMILNVDGVKFKGKSFGEMVAAIRGPAGKDVHLRVLREDRVMNLDITREKVIFPSFGATKVNATTGLLTIGFFSNETPSVVEESLKTLDASISRLILDLRGNGGGTFDDAIKVAELFLPKGSTVAQTRSRDGQTNTFQAHRDPWRPDVRIIVLTDRHTASSAELLTAALREGRQATIIGMPTQGKWNVQSVDTLPNHFAIKYSVMKFESPSGKSYQGVGMKPDLEIDGPKDALLGEAQNETDLRKRLELDAPLKAAACLMPNTACN